jgi:hypothetical protein
MRIGGMSSSRDDSPGRKVYHGAAGAGAVVEMQSASEIDALTADAAGVVKREGVDVGVKLRAGETCEALVDGSQRMDQEGRSRRGRLKGRERVGRESAREVMICITGAREYRCGSWSS